MQDWYYYGLFINHTELVQEICASYGHPDDIPVDELDELKQELEQRYIDEDGK